MMKKFTTKNFKNLCIIHYRAETETIEHVIPVEMTNVTLEKPEIQDEVYVMKGEIKELKHW